MTSQDQALVSQVGGAVAALAAADEAERAKVLVRYANAAHIEAAHGLDEDTDPEVVPVFREAIERLGLTPADVAADVQAIRDLRMVRDEIKHAATVVSKTRTPETVAKVRAGLAWYRQIVLAKIDAAARMLDGEDERWRVEQREARAAAESRRLRVRDLIRGHSRVMAEETP